MTGVAVLTLVVGVAVWALVRNRPRAGEHASDAGDVDATVGGLDPADLADLEARFDGIDADQAARRDAVLRARILPLVRRRVPVRCVEPLAELHAVRVRFADGTAVVVRGEVAGDAGVLACVLRTHAVLPGACSTDAAGTRLVFAWSGGRRHLAVRVAGLDQPD